MERLASSTSTYLIDGHGAGGRHHARHQRRDGVEGELGDYSFHGRTDPGIVRDLAPVGAASWMRSWTSAWHATWNSSPTRSARCTSSPASVRELVTALAVDRRVLLGLLTGNVEEGARIKLAPTG